MPICFSLLAHLVCNALALARAKAGNRSAARMEIIAMTTRSSIRVKPRRCGIPRPIECVRLLVCTVALSAEPAIVAGLLVSPGMSRKWQNVRGGQRPSCTGFGQGFFCGVRAGLAAPDTDLRYGSRWEAPSGTPCL